MVEVVKGAAEVARREDAQVQVRSLTSQLALVRDIFGQYQSRRGGVNVGGS